MSELPKTILITGSTDGIGLLTAKLLAAQGHKLLLHGRNLEKLEAAAEEIGGETERFIADLFDLPTVESMAKEILSRHDHLDVLINNAGILKTQHTRTADGLDIRFVVNTFAPYILARLLLEIMPKDGRIVNLSSAAQAAVNISAMAGQRELDDMDAYSQSKLAITIWSQELARELPEGPVVVAVNPGSLLASKMVKEGFGIAGNDLNIGANILCRAALDPEFSETSGKYFDNNAGKFGLPISAALDADHVSDVMQAMEKILSTLREKAN
ncbi:MAG: SDR family NAD(P)-dependent oxidoreductase [Rhizobiaceae bacterium]